MVRFSVEEVPVKDNIPLEPLVGSEANNETPEPVPSDPLLNNGVHGGDKGGPQKLPTITVTSESGDHLYTKVKVDSLEEQEGL